MTQFVHLADAKDIASIRRSGIRLTDSNGPLPKGFYCAPVTRSSFKTHQWLRELKRKGARTIAAVQFYLASDEPVYVGHFNEDLILTTASEALGIVEAHVSGLGLEVLIPRVVSPREIRRIYTPKQGNGWRFHPEAKGKKPFCGCRYCNRGQINASRVITEP